MDPLSITAGCTGVLSTIATLTINVTKFVGEVRDSGKEMRAVNRELSDLSFCVERLQEDFTRPGTSCPDELQDHLLVVLKNCDSVMVDMQKLLLKMSSGSLGRKMQWAAFGQSEIYKLREQLAAHKATIDVALTIFSM